MSACEPRLQPESELALAQCSFWQAHRRAERRECSDFAFARMPPAIRSPVLLPRRPSVTCHARPRRPLTLLLEATAADLHRHLPDRMRSDIQPPPSRAPYEMSATSRWLMAARIERHPCRQ